MKEIPLIYVYDDKVIDENGVEMKNWKERMEKFREVYVMDLDGISKNEPNVDFYRNLYKKMWVDSFPRRFDDIVDLVVAGAEKIVIRNGFREEDIDRVFDEIDVEIYLSLTEEFPYAEHKDKWSGFVYLLNRAMDFSIKDFISKFFNLYIVARRREYIDTEWLEGRDIEGLIYPLWEMEA